MLCYLQIDITILSLSINIGFILKWAIIFDINALQLLYLLNINNWVRV